MANICSVDGKVQIPKVNGEDIDHVKYILKEYASYSGFEYAVWDKPDETVITFNGGCRWDARDLKENLEVLNVKSKVNYSEGGCDFAGYFITDPEGEDTCDECLPYVEGMVKLQGYSVYETFEWVEFETRLFLIYAYNHKVLDHITAQDIELVTKGWDPDDKRKYEYIIKVVQAVPHIILRTGYEGSWEQLESFVSYTLQHNGEDYNTVQSNLTKWIFSYLYSLYTLTVETFCEGKDATKWDDVVEVYKTSPFRALNREYNMNTTADMYQLNDLSKSIRGKYMSKEEQEKLLSTSST